MKRLKLKSTLVYFFVLVTSTRQYEGGTGQSDYYDDVVYPDHAANHRNAKNHNDEQIVKSYATKTGYHQPKMYTYTPGGHNDYKMFYPEQDNTKQGCTKPLVVMYAQLNCVVNQDCRATCKDGYQFPNKETIMLFTCNSGTWETKGFTWSGIPNCEPICLPACQNKGICIAPGQCNCAENFSGPQCQYEKKPCINNPPLPLNSKRVCKSSSCTIQCFDGYQFPDGSTIANLICKEGNWVPSKVDIASIPDCQPTCNPACENGGVCLSLNVCQCPKKYRGSTCQYSINACDAKKLNFNGGYSCSGDEDEVSCIVKCPQGMQFEFDPASIYKCMFSTGTFMPQPVPQCIFSDVHGDPSLESLFEDLSMNPNQSQHHMYEKYVDPNHQMASKNYAIDSKLPKSGSCFTWGGVHYKTFDGKVYSFNSACRHILIRDDRDNTFSITVENTGFGRKMHLFIQDKEFTMEPHPDGRVLFRSEKRVLPIPAQLSGFRVEMAGHMILMTLEGLGVKVKWNAANYIQVDVTEAMWNKTGGLCGKIDGYIENDIMTQDGIEPKSLATLFSSWQLKKIDDEFCDSNPNEQHACGLQNVDLEKDAEKFCHGLLGKPKFSACSKIMDISLLYESCKWDYCACRQMSHSDCACEGLAVYVSQCVSQGVTSLQNWRDEETCKMKCTGGMVYQSCGPSVQVACGSASSTLEEGLLRTSEGHTNKKTCTEGCFCPAGTLFYDGYCATKDQCPCRYRGKEYPPGSEVAKDCNTCSCQNGEWVCTQITCGARCAAIGDPHYQTFDGKRYNFMGKCSYTLLKASNLSIEAENVACSGAISEAMNLPPSGNLWEMPSCTKALTIKYKDSVVQLKQGRVVIINGKEINKFPTKFLGMKISIVSSLFAKVAMPNKIDVWWDGQTRAYIDAPASFKGKTKGLCGTLNSNQKDDFLTPEDDIEQSIVSFANKWKTKEKCDDMPDRTVAHPCVVNAQNKPTAEKLCSKLKSKLFSECHWNVDFTPFYEDCLYDVCSCKGPIDKCLCPILGAYATECARQGVEVQWRYSVKECEIHCNGGQTYQVCGDSCARSCYDISVGYEDLADAAEEAHCKPQCVEGCNCPEGKTLDEFGECIPVGSCPCWHAGIQFPAQYKEVRPGAKQQELCVCIGAQWQCKPASDTEIKRYPRAMEIKDKCSAANHEEFTTCEPEEHLTCRNMHQPAAQFTPVECRPGCKCKSGFVLDSISKKCVKPEDCPCHHGGKSYADGERMQEDCNTCKCKSGKWSCEKRQCAGTCSSWGDSHFRTFDGHRYDFQGVCTYLLAKGTLDQENNSFSIEIQNEVCGTSGVTCSKSVTLKVGSIKSTEVITFTKNKAVPDGADYKRIKIRKAGLFVYAEVPSLGVTLQWDKGTRVYVKLNPPWKGRARGLCGNYNDNEADEFQTPSGGITEASVQLFGDSWKLDNYCPAIQSVQDACHAHPERRIWSSQRCGVLKQYPFTACHSEVPPGDFLQRCENDACACNKGGDCECLCTALAAYAYECAGRGVAIKWRTQDMCPMQCDETCTNYSPCMSTCPLETCDNTVTYSQIISTCKEDTCVEGCEHKKLCADGQVFTNASAVDCVPRSACKGKGVCMTSPDGRAILEGETIVEDECHSCYCSRGKEVCSGQPCSTTIAPEDEFPEPEHMDQNKTCQSGWTPWINMHTPNTEKLKGSYSAKPYSVEKESLPSVFELINMNGAYCTFDKMKTIECRTVHDQTMAKDTGLDAECSIEKGLFCRQPQSTPCPDFEIRVKCICMQIGNLKKSLGRSGGSFKCNLKLKEHPSDCSKYLECNPFQARRQKIEGYYIEKKCEPGTMFNPNTTMCDWPQNVFLIKPICEVEAITEVYTITPESQAKNLDELGSGRHTNEELIRSVCDMKKQYLEHPTDCALFYQCAPGMGPREHPNVVLKTCGNHMFFHPVHLVCDFPQSVMAIRPNCHFAEATTHPTVGYNIIFPEKGVKNTTCELGKVWSDCAVNCKRVCRYYHYYLQSQGKCKRSEVCVPGCIDKEINQKECPKGHYWRDAKTCVNVRDCTCHSHQGSPVKPGVVLKESECEICQCLENRYTCDKSTCTDFTPGPTEPVVMVMEVDSEEEAEDDDEGRRLKFSTTASYPVTPPPECNPDKYKDVMWGDAPFGADAFYASSSLNNMFLPQDAKLNGKSTETSSGSWSPGHSDAKQYIQVKLPRKEPIYGVWMQGSPIFDQYITSYKVLYGDDGKKFVPVKDASGYPQIFRGPIDHNSPMKQMFNLPIEMKYVRIVPVTWHDNISVRFELIGCKEVQSPKGPKGIRGQVGQAGPSFTTTISYRHDVTVTTTYSPIELAHASDCEEPMGVNDGRLLPKFIKASSQKPDHPASSAKLSHSVGWQPLTNSPKEWIKFDFTAPRNLTGIVSKGGPDGWVESYVVRHSPDDFVWHKILNGIGEEQIFPANIAPDISVINKFGRPVHARYMKIFPTEWKDNIQMRVEPLGCFKPYVLQTEDGDQYPLVKPEVDFLENCDLCDGIPAPKEECNCTSPMLYDGHKCVPNVECPCIVGHIPYEIGEVYKTEDCQLCTCKLGGVPICFKKVCPVCKPGFNIQTTADCECQCVPCPDGKRSCPTSQTCIDEDLWCNGVEDCPDDELNCNLKIETTTAKAELIEDCPTPSCPTGYKVVIKKSSSKLEMLNEDEFAADSLLAQPVKSARKSYMRYYKGGGTKTASRVGGVKRTRRDISGGINRHRALELPPKVENNKNCAQWRCVSTRPPPPLGKPRGLTVTLPPCPVPKCPPEYKMRMENEDLDEHDCPKYVCTPPPRRDAVCNITGKTFNTFDGVKYQYDICDHILARDADNSAWAIAIQKNCTKISCVHELVIVEDLEQVRFKPDLTIDYNGYQYTVDQTKKIGFQTKNFVISRLGQTLFYVSTQYGFWVIFNRKGHVKIGVAGKHFEHVDGLCGFYNGEPDDDRRLPDGEHALSTEEFGESWMQKDSSMICDTPKCPIHLQGQVWDMCTSINDKAFKSCTHVMNFEPNRQRCLEEACDCLQEANEGANSTDKNKIQQRCTCNALQSYVSDCMGIDQSINLQGWRTKLNCPAICPAPLVHFDCFRHSCELSCDNLKEEKPCPPTPGVCFSGCFCPEGLVRKGESCVLPTECRDCVCDDFGKPDFVTFDRRNFTFDGNCAYTVVRDKAQDNKHIFEVYVQFEKCQDNAKAVCTKSIHLVYNGHTLHLQKHGNNLEAFVDGMKTHHFPLLNEWLHLDKVSNTDISLLLPAIQLEMLTLFHNMAFTVKLPSKLYSNKVEGLCGNCNGDDSDDLGPSKDPVKYALNWRAPHSVLEKLHMDSESCVEKPKDECWPLPPEEDPCFKIMNSDRFGKCHLVVDPAPYLASCQKDICSVDRQVGVCASLEMYTRECLRAGICLDWRSDEFCPYHCDHELKYKACSIGCQITCDNYEKFTKKPSLCTASPVEGCYCPNGKILHNGKCVDHSKCFPCDSHGHYVGDKWQVDECTKCTCSKDNGISCVKQTCIEDIACTEGYMAKEMSKAPGACCAEYICVPAPTESTLDCEEPTKMSCGFGQVLKLETFPNKCPQFICKCKPPEECDPIKYNKTEQLEPGMESYIDESGCCKKLKNICKPEKCPKKTDCPKFYVLKTKKKESDCCPKYSCEPPSDKCLYDMEYESSPKGGEIRRETNMKETIAKEIGAMWQDGPCRSCICKKIEADNKTKASCSVTECPLIPKSKDFDIKPVGVPNECCHKPKYLTCLQDEKAYSVGDIWKSITNPCESFKCVEKSNGILEKQKIVKQCNKDCKQGWKYMPPIDDSVCCGECIPKACVVNGVEHKIDDVWQSSDYCKSYKCVKANGTLQVQSNIVNCPLVSADLKNEFEIKEVPLERECCKKIVKTACKINGLLYTEGSSWNSTEDPCKYLTCNRDQNGDLTKVESYESCNMECANGWEYKSSDDPHTCCGRCVQTACILDNVTYKPGTTWYSKDKCTQFTCTKEKDQLLITSHQESCPDVSECDLKNIYTKGCCKHCNITALAQSMCAAEDMPLKSTVGLVRMRKPFPQGLCINKSPIKGFKHCTGSCKSGTNYNEEKTDFDTDCKCCQESKHDRVIVDLICENSSMTKKAINVPTECECLACIGDAANSRFTKNPTKTAGRYSPRSNFSPERNVYDEDVEMLDVN